MDTCGTSPTGETLFRVRRLKLAAWLYINGQNLVARRLDSDHHHITYYFEYKPEIDQLVEQWLNKRGVVNLQTLIVFAEAVSFEIRTASRLRNGGELAQLRLPRRREQVAPNDSQASA
jgi:hypothetical protein